MKWDWRERALWGPWLAWAISCLLHALVIGWFWHLGPPAGAARGDIVELDVRLVPRVKLPPGPGSPVAQAPGAADARRRDLAAVPLWSSPGRRGAGEERPGGGGGPRLPSAGPARPKASRELDLGLAPRTFERSGLPGAPGAEEAGGASGRGAGAEGAQAEGEEVRQRVDALIEGAQAEAHDLASVPDEAPELGTSVEAAATHPRLSAEERRAVEEAVSDYLERLDRYGRSARPPANEGAAGPFDQVEDAALIDLRRQRRLYFVVVELFRSGAGEASQVKLVASSGCREFDSLALAAVTRGALGGGEAPPPSPRGEWSVWAIRGERLGSKGRQAATSIVRHLLLDVVPLKETFVELERNGQKERLKFSARRLAVR